jgi:hypothetical protein
VSAKRASPASPQSPPEVPAAARQEKTTDNGTPLLPVAYGNKQAHVWRPLEPMTWPQFVDWLDLDQPEDYKDCGAYVVGELVVTTGCRSQLGGPNCTTLHRNARAVVSRAVLALDADTASQSLVPDAAVELGCALAAYTTWSHTPEKPRWRLLAPLSRPVAPAEYDLIARAVMHDLGAEQFDPGSAEPWRLMHRPSTQGGYEFQVVQGAPLDADLWLARAAELDLSARREPPAPQTDESPAYADLSPDVQAHVDRYFQAIRKRELDKLAALPRPWVSGESYWDLGVFSVACNLQEFANSNWCNYTMEQAYQDVMENAPSDEAWGESEHEDKWESAEGRVGGKARPMPKLPSSPADDFGDDFVSRNAAATNADVEEFIAAHDDGDRRAFVLEQPVALWHNKVDVGEPRHATMAGLLADALKEAAAGLYPARLAVEQLEKAWLSRILEDGQGPNQGAARTQEQAEEEWNGLLAEAVAQARAADPAETLGLRDRWPLLDIVGLLDPARPERTWLWEGIVPQGDQASIVAPAGIGKSLMVLALVWSCLRGEDSFIGRGVTFTGKVLYIDKENSEDDWAERLRDLGVTQDEARALLGTRFFPLSLPRMAGLDTKPGAGQLVEVLDLYGLEPGDLVILDSTQRITEGEENSNDSMRALYKHTVEELKRRELTVIRTDNTGKDTDRGARGASAKGDDVGYSWLLKKQGDDVFTLAQAKKRSKGQDDDLTFRRETDDRGLLTFTLVPPRQAAASARADAAVMEKVAAFLGALGAGHKGASKTFIRGQVSAGNQKVDAALDELVRLGYVSATVDGQAMLHLLVKPYVPDFEDEA